MSFHRPETSAKRCERLNVVSGGPTKHGWLHGESVQQGHRTQAEAATVLAANAKSAISVL
jgi:hypothetical protein